MDGRSSVCSGVADATTSNHFQSTQIAEQVNREEATPLNLPPNYLVLDPFSLSGERILAAFQDAQDQHLYLAIGDITGFEFREYRVNLCRRKSPG